MGFVKSLDAQVWAGSTGLGRRNVRTDCIISGVALVDVIDIICG